MTTRLKINDEVDIEFKGYRIIGTLEGATYINYDYKDPISENTDLSTLKFSKYNGTFIAGENIRYGNCTIDDFHTLVFCKPDSNGDLKPIGVLIPLIHNDDNRFVHAVKANKTYEETIARKTFEEAMAELTDSESSDTDSESSDTDSESPDKDKDVEENLHKDFVRPLGGTILTEERKVRKVEGKEEEEEEKKRKENVKTIGKREKHALIKELDQAPETSSIILSPSSPRSLSPTIYFKEHEIHPINSTASIQASREDGLCLYALDLHRVDWKDKYTAEDFERLLNPVTSIKLSCDGRVDIKGDLYINNEKYEKVSLADFIFLPELLANNEKRIKALEDNTSIASSYPSPDFQDLKQVVMNNQKKIKELEDNTSIASSYPSPDFQDLKQVVMNNQKKIKELEDNTSIASTDSSPDFQDLKQVVMNNQKKIKELEAFIDSFRKSIPLKSDRNVISYIAGEKTTTFDFYE